jgi:hypothetical protein
MTRGRRPRGFTSIDGLDGPIEEKKRLRTILERLGGQINVEEACAVLGISRALYYVLEKKVLDAGLVALLPRPIGRPPEEKPGEPPELKELREQNRQLGLALEASRVREELWATMPDVAKRVLGDALKKGAEKSR